MADGDIRRISGDGPATTKRRGKVKRVTASPKAVQRLRPERNEIIIRTGLSIQGAGVQCRGSIATGPFRGRKQR